MKSIGLHDGVVCVQGREQGVEAPGQNLRSNKAVLDGGWEIVGDMIFNLYNEWWKELINSLITLKHYIWDKVTVLSCLRGQYYCTCADNYCGNQ